MEKFLERYKKILHMAMQGGIEAVPLRPPNIEGPFYDSEHRDKFLKACHRGYEIAQKSIIKEIDLIWSLEELSDDEKFFRELLYRKIIDFIAYSMLEGKIHVARRLILHDAPVKADLSILKRDLKEAEKLNSESRLTFALLADLTTYIHVFDLLRIDHRKRPKLDFIELKSGKINSMILSELDNFVLDNSLIEKIEHENVFPERYKSQAKRIVKQKLRVENINEVLKKDVGFDTKTNEPLLLSENEIELESYDNFLNELCNRSRESNSVSGTFQYCIHIGVGNSAEYEKSLHYARKALNNAFVITHQSTEDNFIEIEKEVYFLIKPEDYLKVSNPLKQNLFSAECVPFLSWKLDLDYILKIISGELVILIGFDIASFTWIGRKMGYNVNLTTRKKSAEILNKFGSKGVPLWNRRAVEIKYKESSHLLMSGMFVRFINHFSSPLQFFNEKFYQFDDKAKKQAIDIERSKE